MEEEVKKDEKRCTMPGCRRTISCSHTACPMRKMVTAQVRDGVEALRGSGTFHALPTLTTGDDE